jgi:hypothetical protein
MMSACKRSLFILAGVLLAFPTLGSSADLITGDGWPQLNRDMHYGHFWDQFTNRHYGGYNNALTWPGGWWDVGANDPVQRRTFANYKGFVIGAVNVTDPQYPAVTWPYMVGQRDGWNDGENGTDIVDVAPDPLAIAKDVQFIFKGRLDRRTYRQALADVQVNGVANPFLQHIDDVTLTWPQLVGDESDAPYQNDVIDPTIPADVVLDTYSWSRMGVSTNRRVYSFADRNNDDYMFWHWRMINDGLWGKMGVNTVDCCGGTHGTVEGVMMSLMFQWDRSSAGAARTSSSGESNNDTIWRYYGLDYDGAQTEDMRLVYLIDGDQDPSKYSPAHGKQNDIGDPDPTTGELLSAKTAGWQILHYDVSTSDRNDDVAQPRTIGWQNYNLIIRTGTENPNSDQGHEAKYKQMLLGYQGPSQYYYGPAMNTTGRGAHPEAGTAFASWIKASNDPATSGTYWPGKVLGVDVEVTDIEQQAGFGPDDIAAGDTINALFVLGVKGLEEPYAIQVGRQWLAGTITDAQKDELVHSTIDSLFNVMRQAKDVYETSDFGGRYASTRAEFETSLWAAIDAGKLALSPPAPASFTVNEGSGKVDLSWTLNTTTGSSIAGWRVYRALASMKGDSAFVMIHQAAPGELSYSDTDVEAGFSYFYYLTTFDSDGNESTMHTRSSDPAIPSGSAINAGQPLKFELAQNAPNPFNPNTSIRLSLPNAGETRLDIYSVNGQLVKSLVNGFMPAGIHNVEWNGTDATGHSVASGTYIYRLVNGDDVQVRRMVLVR